LVTSVKNINCWYYHHGQATATGDLGQSATLCHRDRSTSLFNKKAVLSQRWPRNAPHIWVPWKLSGFLTMPTATRPKIFHGLLFWLTLWMCVQNLKSVASPVSELIRGSQKLGLSLAIPKKNPICLPCRLFIHVHSFSRDFRLQFWVGVANPQFWGRGAVGFRDSTVRKSVGGFL